MLADGGAYGGLPLMLIQNTGNPANMVEAQNLFTGYFTLVLDNAGNLAIPGHIYTGGSCVHGCSGTRRVLAYGSMASRPTLDDIGEAQLHSGAATVALDPAFANAIDQRAGYVVLLTPEGDTAGLYVAQRSPGSFVVRETARGRGSVDFAYRIVAHPYGAAAPRLPMVSSLRNLARLATQSH